MWPERQSLLEVGVGHILCTLSPVNACFGLVCS